MPFKYTENLESEKRIMDWDSFSKFVFSKKEDDRKKAVQQLFFNMKKYKN